MNEPMTEERWVFFLTNKQRLGVTELVDEINRLRSELAKLESDLETSNTECGEQSKMAVANYNRAEAAERQLAASQAQVESLKDAAKPFTVGKIFGMDEVRNELRHVLSSTPSELLAEHDKKVRRETLVKVADKLDNITITEPKFEAVIREARKMYSDWLRAQAEQAATLKEEVKDLPLLGGKRGYTQHNDF